MSDEPLKWGTPEWHRANAIFGTDFSKPPAALIEDIRNQLARLRGQLSDIGNGYPGFKQQLECAEGTLTCCIAYLYYTKKEMQELKLGEIPPREEPRHG